MATMKMPCAVGGGGGLISVGDIVVDGTRNDYTVNCGFKPKYIIVLFQGATGSVSSSAAGAVRLIYDEDYSPNYSYAGYNSNSGGAAVSQFEMPKAIGTASPYIASISSTGFVLNSHTAAGYIGTWKYVASEG